MFSEFTWSELGSTTIILKFVQSHTSTFSCLNIFFPCIYFFLNVGTWAQSHTHGAGFYVTICLSLTR